MSSITIDGLDEEIFRRNIEGMLRVGEADRAAAKLRALITPFCGEGGILPARFAEVSSADIILKGWDKLAASLARNDRPRHPISALTIAVSNAEVLGFDSDDQGPLIATSHFTDEAYPFSNSGLGDLLDGYSFYGCEWHGSSAHVDTALSLGGIDDLYRAIAAIEGALIASARPDPDKIRAGSIGSCYLAVLVYQAVRDAVRTAGVPRAICVMAGNEGIYPYFDAPVIGSMECVEQGLVAAATVEAADAVAGDPLVCEAVVVVADAEPAEEAAAVIPAGTFGSLSSLVSRKSEKKPVLQLADGDAQMAAEMFDRAGEDWMRGTVGAPLPSTLHIEEPPDDWDTGTVTEGDIFADLANFRELAVPVMPYAPDASEPEVVAADIAPQFYPEEAAPVPDGVCAEERVDERVLADHWPEDLAPKPGIDGELPVYGLDDVEIVPPPEAVSRTSHSIRSRITVPEPEPEPVRASLWTLMVRWVSRRFG